MLDVRSATQEDIPQILLITELGDRFRLSKFTHCADEEELRFWVSDPRSVFIVSTFNVKLVGYAYGFAISPKWFFFDSFFVVPEYQNRGVGKRMYNYLRNECRKLGFQLIQGLVKDTDDSSLKYWVDHEFEIGCKCIWVEDWLDED